MVTRKTFLAGLLGSAAAVKAVAQTENGERPKEKRLLAIEFDHRLSMIERERLQIQLKPYTDQFSVEFLILEDGARLVDPAGPASTPKTENIEITVHGNLVANRGLAEAIADSLRKTPKLQLRDSGQV